MLVGRALQGLGAGAIQPIGMTVIGDLYSVAERAKVQGYLASVWGVSAVLGPLMGGLFSDYVSWRCIFWRSRSVRHAARSQPRRRGCSSASSTSCRCRS